MSMIHSVRAVAGLIFVMNMPFGFWRAGVRKFSPRWFVAVHAPVVLGIGVRILAGIPLRLLSLPLFVAAFFLGQTVGGRARVGLGGLRKVGRGRAGPCDPV